MLFLECLTIEENFLCDSGQCLGEGVRCDGYEDCDDGSDELDCRKHLLKPNNNDCNHGDAVYVTFSLAVEFLQTHCDGFVCLDLSACIGSDSLCDGTSQCPDGSDETGCGALIFTLDYIQ